MLSWQAILSILSNGLAFLRKIAEIISTAAAKKAGRDEANAETLRQNAERTAKAKQVEEETVKEHLKKPNNDSAFDTSFRRD